MTFERKFTTGNLIEIVVIAAMIILSFGSVQSRVTALEQQVTTVQEQASKDRTKLETEYVRNDVYQLILRELDDIKNSVNRIEQRTR